MSATAGAAATPRPVTVNFLPSELSGTTGFFPFHDLEILSGTDDADDAAAFFQKFLIRPSPADDDDDNGRHMWLFSTGCRVDDDGGGGGGGVADCPRACRHAATLFGSLETFYNCAALSSIAYWTRAASAGPGPGPSPGIGTGLYYLPDEAAQNASAVMAGTPLAAFDERPVLASFVACAQAACGGGGDGIRKPCSPAVQALSALSSPPQVFDAMGSFCPSIPVEINPDIFGPGVLISYVLQVCFASFLFLALKAFTLCVTFSHTGKSSSPKRRPGSRPGSRPPLLHLHRRLTRIESIIWRDSSALSRTSVALATTLVEFQEAQCWFVFAIQIASILAIVVNSQEGTFWGEIVVNAAVAFHVSQNGILPMFLVQLCLHNEGIRNWHTFLGFFAEYLLAIVATSQRVRFRDAFELFRKEREIEACGGNPSPRSYCASMHGVEGLHLGFFPRPYLYKVVFLVLDTVAIVTLLIDQLSWTMRTHRLTRDISISGYRLGRGPRGRFKSAWLRFKRVVWWSLELSYLVVNILYMVSLVKVFSDDSFEASKWSYGQIIAMTVWGPVIVKLFDLVLSGPPKNGTSLNSGPPRLRIDNVINHRLGTSADEVLDDDDYVPELDIGRGSRQHPSPDRIAGEDEMKTVEAGLRRVNDKH